ncbi:MAG: pteridine-dependent deoxygenase [Rudaea sp.]
MTLRPSPAATSTTALPTTLAPLHVEYAHIDPAHALAQTDVLAAIGFGVADGDHDDPRWLRVALKPDGAAPLEIWRVEGRAECGRNGELRWASDGNYSFVALELDEAAHGGIAAAARQAYAQLSDWRSRCATPHFLRLWNYLDAINGGDGDAERYRQFCTGRAAGMDTAFTLAYPAATAIGVRDGRRVLQVYALAARAPGTPVENPRQLNAWCYPRQYGPAAPGFARGMRAPALAPQLHISGTAAIVGHASHHAGDLTAQLDETLANLHSLLDAAGSDTPLGNGSLLKVYVRHAEDVAAVRELLHSRLHTAAIVLLHADICRRELLLEIDGLHRG